LPCSTAQFENCAEYSSALAIARQAKARMVTAAKDDMVGEGV